MVRVLVINGPNLNVLAQRDPKIYGGVSIAEIEKVVLERALGLGVEAKFFQSNHEGAIVDYLQEQAADASGIVINPGALTHYSTSLREALVDTGLPVVEVHISNIHSREEWRAHSVIAPIAVGQVVGLGWRGYIYALEFLEAHIQGG
jgi:3-dehydroquinate dehydratase-2